MVIELEKYCKKNIRNLQKIRGFWGSIYKDCLLLLLLLMVVVVFVVAMLKSNLKRIPKQNIYMRIKENSDPPCRAGPLARVHMEIFHLT